MRVVGIITVVCVRMRGLMDVRAPFAMPVLVRMGMHVLMGARLVVMTMRGLVRMIVVVGMTVIVRVVVRVVVSMTVIMRMVVSAVLMIVAMRVHVRSALGPHAATHSVKS